MAGKTFAAHGKVTKGDFLDCTVWCIREDLFYVVSKEFTYKLTHYELFSTYVTEETAQVKDEYTVGGWPSDFKTTDELEAFLNKFKQYEITSSVIEKIVDVSSYKTGPDASKFIEGMVTGGFAFGAAKAMASSTSSRTLAVYTKDGKKMLIKFTGDITAADFQTRLFVL